MGQNLTTLAGFKSWYNLPATNISDDAFLTALIQAASLSIINYLQRPSLFKNVFTDYVNGTGGNRLQLRNWPVTALASLSVDGAAQTVNVTPPTKGIFLDPYDGFPPGRLQNVNFLQGEFCKGLRNVAMTYTAGYQVVNEAQKVSSTAYQVTATQSLGMWGQDDGVAYSSGGALTPVSSAPSVGTYNAPVSSAVGVYQFAAADANANLNLNYSFVPWAIQQACNQWVGEQYAYRQRIGQKSRSLAGQETVSFDNRIMTDIVKALLQPFKRMVPA